MMELTIVMSVLEIMFMIACAVLLAIEHMKENRTKDNIMEEVVEDENITYLHDIK